MELGVGFILDGTLQGNESQLRATANLIDVATGAQLWSQRFDRPLGDLAAAQNDLTQRIASKMVAHDGVVLQAAIDAARRKPAEDLRPHELLLLGMEQRLLWTKDGNSKALELIERALAMDAHDTAAHVQLAYIYMQQMVAGWAESNNQTMEGWLEAAKTAVRLDPNYAFARLVLGSRYNWAGDARAGAELERAAELAPGNAEILREVAVELPWLGQTARAEELIERSLEINPAADSLWAERMVYFFAQRFEDAAAAADGETNPDRDTDLWGTLSYAQLDDAADLERWGARLRDSWPDYSAELFLGAGDFGRGAVAERRLFMESHTRAGLPICATQEQLVRHAEIKRLPECTKAEGKN